MSNAVHNLGAGYISVMHREWDTSDGHHAELILIVRGGMQVRFHCSAQATDIVVVNPISGKAQEVKLK